MEIAAIRSEGDLEVVALHEAHQLLASLIGPSLYIVGGSPPNQTAQFHNEQSFDLFLILLLEFVTEGARSALIADQFRNLSLLSALNWLCERHPNEARTARLSESVSSFETWLEREVPFEFWAPDAEAQIRFDFPNKQLLSFGANTKKHRLLRLSNLTSKLRTYCEGAGYDFTPQQTLGILRNMEGEVDSRLSYHSTYLLELAGTVFFALNTLIKRRFEENPTNRGDRTRYPDGITSSVFRDLYIDVMVFRNYPDERIRNHTPATSEYLRLRY